MSSDRDWRHIQDGMNADEADFRPWPSYCLLLLAVAVLAGALFSSTFHVHHIAVSGNGLPYNRIVQAVDANGSSIFTLRATDIADRLAVVPDIVVRSVTLEVPDTVAIRASRRIAVVAWSQDHMLLLVDDTGRIIGTATRASLPTIYAAGPRIPLVGSDLDRRIVTAALYVKRALPGYRRLTYTLTGQRGIVIQAAAGWQAALGRPSEAALVRRVNILRALLAARTLSASSPLYIDLRYSVPYIATHQR